MGGGKELRDESTAARIYEYVLLCLLIKHLFFSSTPVDETAA